MLHITKTRRIMPPRIVVYGAGGIGKSTLASKFPSPLFIQTEDGLSNIDAVSAGLCHSFTDFTVIVSELINHPDQYADYKTIVIDSLDWLERLVWAEICSQNKLKSIEGLAYGRGYNMAADLWRVILAQLDALHKTGKILVLLAHGVPTVVSDPEVSELRKFDIKLHKAARSLVVEWADLVLFATRKRGTARGNVSERVLKAEDCPQYFAKSRYNLPADINLDPRVLLGAIAEDQQREESGVPF